MPELPSNLLTTGIFGDVIDNQDPEGLGRVIVEVNALSGIARLEWAWPVGFPGAGNKDRGFFWPPDVGSSVYIMFEMGSQTRPVYLAGPHTMPNQVSEVPSSFSGQENVTPTKRGWETKEWEVLFEDGLPPPSLDSSEFRVKRKGGTAFLKFKSDGTVVLEGIAIELGDAATEAVLKGDKFKAIYDAHTHPDPVSGNSGPPNVLLPADNLSTTTTVGG